MYKRIYQQNEKFNKINCHSFQTIFKVNTNFNLTSFNIRILDENNNKIGHITSSCKVYFKHEDKNREEFLCNNECQSTINNINNEIKNYALNYKCKQDLFLSNDENVISNKIDDKPIPFNLLDFSTDILILLVIL